MNRLQQVIRRGNIVAIVRGTLAADRLVGTADADQIYGYDGNDRLSGEAGNDYLVGGAGADIMAGGQGDDVYEVDSTGDYVVEAPGEGIDRVRASVNHTLRENIEILVLTGGANINGSGNALDNTIVGNAGNNILNGGAGADIMIGGAGDDVYEVDSAGDRAIEAAGEGIDRVRASVTHALGANVENLILLGTADINGFGNALANIIAGNAGSNVLNGGAGDDTLIGGAGDDVYDVDSARDQVLEAVGQGHDRVRTTVSHALKANVEDLSLHGVGDINGFGNALANSIIGNAGNNVLNGGAGDDVLAGRAGDDVYDVDSYGDRVIEASNEGHDRVRTSLSEYTLSANVEDLSFTSAAFPIYGVGNALDNMIIGNGNRDSLWGGGGNDVLYGKDGNDLLIGEAGDDILIGGAGDDEYNVDSTSDRVQELAGEGTDLVRASISYTLAANVEKLVLEGWASINGFGNSSNNTITGNARANVLNGMAGNDVLIGGAGNDVYDVDTIDDVAVEEENGGYDRIRSSANDYILGSNVEELNLVGTAVRGTGNELANTLIGSAANNELFGEDGNDLLSGGDGNDYLSGGAGIDILRGGAGNDSLDAGSAALAGEIYDGGAGIDTLSFFAAGEVVDLSRSSIVGIERIDAAGKRLSISSAQLNSIDELSADAITIVGGGNTDLAGLTSLSVGSIALGNDSNTLNGGAHNLYYVAGGSGVDRITGWGVLSGNGGDDILTAAGRDTNLLGGDGNDVLNAGETGVMLEGGNGSDHLYGGAASLTLSGGAGDDFLYSGNGGAWLVGGDGNDWVEANAGYNTMLGGAGQDKFAFTVVGGSYYLEDFSVSDDKLVFKGLVQGNFSYIGTASFSAAGHGEARFDVGGIALYVDVDGDGRSDLAISMPDTNLSSANFIIL